MDDTDTRHRGFTRRDVLRGTAGATAALLAGCDVLSTDPEGTSNGGSSTGDRSAPKEAPMLAERVKAGELPSVEDRLPTEPMTLEPVDEAGTYGGSWRTVTSGTADAPWFARTIAYDFLLSWSADWKEVLPNVATEVTGNEQGTEYTIKLRPGMKWSDGKPFGPDDIMFAYNDVMLNEELFPGGAWEQGRAEKVDDHTVRIVFDQPSGLFPQRLCVPEGALWVTHPKHYLEKFHKDHNPDVAALAEEEGYSSWIELFYGMGGGGHYAGAYWQVGNEIPTLSAWTVTKTIGDGNRMEAERNPYYFKVDTAGSQLPYLDRVEFDVVTNPETMLLKASNGELDMHSRHFVTEPNKPVLARSRESGNFAFFEAVPSQTNQMVINLNLTHPNPRMREVLQNKDFRIGLSHAIDRNEVINTAYQRQGEPWQAAPRPEGPLLDEEFAKQYTEYNVDKANQHLDQSGFTERDGDGFRLRSDGERISIAVETTADEPPAQLELIKGYWEAVGVHMSIRTQDRSLWEERTKGNQHDAAVWNGAAGLRDALLDPHDYFPSSDNGSRYAIAWAQWYESNGERGEEPPEPAKRQMELYGDLRAETDQEAQYEIMREILTIAKEQFYAIGTVLTAAGYGIVRNDFHNVPKSMPSAWMFPNPGPTRPEQYFTTRT